MADFLRSFNLPISEKSFSGGLNSTGNPINLQENESPDCLNVDFDKFGSVLKRNGYTVVNTTAFNSGAAWTSLYWFQQSSANAGSKYLVGTCGNKVAYWNGITGSPTDITNGFSISANQNNLWQWETFLDTALGCDGSDSNVQITTTQYTFTITAPSPYPVNGSVYSNNSQNFTVISSSGTTLVATGTGAPSTGALTNVSGTGQASINFSSVSTATNSITSSAMNMPTNVTNSQWIKVYNNYIMLGNVTLSGVKCASRIYWSDLRALTFTAINFVDINRDDGQAITGLAVLGDRLVVFKEKSIWVGTFTGDVDIPFNFIKSLSEVGCINGYSIQNAINGLIFQAQDGIYFFDGYSSYKLSYRIQNTLNNMNPNRFQYGASVYQYQKNKYWLPMSQGSNSTNNQSLIYDTFNNAFSLYQGQNINAMARVVNNGVESIYFGDYNGYVCLADSGTDDYPLNVQTAVSSYYYTKWYDEGDTTNQKGWPEIVIYYDLNSATLTLNYSYDMSLTDDYIFTFSTQQSGTGIWGTALWGAFVWGGLGGSFRRVDLDGRGRVIRYKISNANMGETFKINGIGKLVYRETNV